MTRTALALSALVGLAATPLLAQPVPMTLNYQGQLAENTPSQKPVNATLPMRFSIWDSPLVGFGTQLWVETWDAPNSPVVVTNGIFSVLLGSVTPIPSSVFAPGAPRFLQIEVGPLTPGEILSPRQQLASVPWAMKADLAEAATTATSATTADTSLDLTCLDCVDSTEVQFPYAGSSSEGGPASDLACANCVADSEVSDNLTVNNGGIYFTPGTTRLGVGTTSPQAGLHLTGDAGDAAIVLENTNGGVQWQMNSGDGGPFKIARTSVFDAITILPTSEVGIGTISPTEALTVAGIVESTSGGFKFPDGSMQSSAASGASADPVDDFLLYSVDFDQGITVGTGYAARYSGFLSLNQTGQPPNSLLEISGPNNTHGLSNLMVGLDRPGAFFTARVRIAEPVDPGQFFFVLAGDAFGEGMGFQMTSGGNLRGMTYTASGQAFTPPLPMTVGVWYEVYAVRRTSGIDFEVDGAPLGTINTNLPSGSEFMYHVRMGNGASAATTEVHVGIMTIGIPRL